jgi:type I restriction enzyme S subunit
LPIISEIIDILLDNAEVIKPLGDSELTKKILHPFRFKRVYLDDKGNGIPFFGGKGLNELNPSKKYISINLHSKILPSLTVKENMIVISRSGTIGKVAIIPQYWNNWIGTDDLLRIVPKYDNIAGYLYMWLSSVYGQICIQRYIYGSVIDHIEIEHIAQIPIPLLKNKDKQKEINDLVLQANKIRTEAFEKEQEAIRLVNDKVIYANS